MNVLGSVLFDIIRQRKLVEGARVEIDRSTLLPRVNERATVGDLIWVKEPFTIYVSRRFGVQGIHDTVPGPVGTPCRTARARAVQHELRCQWCEAHQLPKADSRATLEIEAVSATKLCCIVHMKQVDQLVASRRTA